SDLGLLTGRSSPYLGPLTSMPFVMGHEVVGRTVDELPGLPRGSRVVIDPVLRCAARGLPACPACLAGHTGRCDGITTGRLAAGLQTGFCADTGGGWSRRMLAHASQLHPVPDSLPDELAVLVEPELGDGYLLGGMDMAFECTGGSAGLNTALRSLRAGGTVVTSGMPAGGVDLTPLWYRELQLVGAYASAIGEEPDRGDFPAA